MNRASLPAGWETRRLVLRPFDARDVADVVAFANDEIWGRYLPVPRPYTIEDAREFLAVQLVADPMREPRWAVQFEERMVGSVELSLDRDARFGTIHFAIARRLWGQGLMTEAVGSVVDRAFETLPALVRVAAHADVRNVGSWRVMEKVGLRREGLLRSARILRDERIDDVVHAMVREDWEER